MYLLEELIKKYNAGQCTDDEKAWLEQWYLTFEWSDPKNAPEREKLMELREEAWSAITSGKNPTYTQASTPSITAYRPVYRVKWWHLTAAAVFICAGIFSFFKFFQQPHNSPMENVTRETMFRADVMPGTSKATLVLADGSIVALDSISGERVKEKDGTLIDKQQGKLVYNSTGNAGGPVLYNTLNIPRGAEYQLILPDGSRVWLNAASSLKYPTRFTGTERKVFLKGEAYFEVAKNATMPFNVYTDANIKIEVLGTHFNIMDYDDEAAVKTTLAEGKVKISNQQTTVTLMPSQQAVWKKKLQQMSVRQVDPEKEIAWKNGMIEFNDDDLPYIMRQISRWYDVDVSFEGAVPDESYNGSIPRKATLSEVMQILKIAGVKYWLENKKLVITAR